MKRRAVFFLSTVILLAAGPVPAAPKMEALDQDKDGRPDTWLWRDAENNLKSTAKDTNKDGKPDYFSELLRGRNLVMRESDRNFDGRVDRRWLTQWDPNKRMITGMGRNNIPQYTAMPGYITLWTEEDNDFDGTMEKRTERGKK